VTFYSPSSTILPNFIVLRQPTPEIPSQNICGQANIETVIINV